MSPNSSTAPASGSRTLTRRRSVYARRPITGPAASAHLHSPCSARQTSGSRGLRSYIDRGTFTARGKTQVGRRNTAAATGQADDSVVLSDQFVQTHRFDQIGIVLLDRAVIQHRDVLADRSVTGTLVQRPEHQPVTVPGLELDAGHRLTAGIGESVDPLGDRPGQARGRALRIAAVSRSSRPCRIAWRRTGCAGWPPIRGRRARRTIR